MISTTAWGCDKPNRAPARAAARQRVSRRQHELITEREREHRKRGEITMTKTAKDKKGAASNKNKFKADDKVYAMDSGDLYEAKVSFKLTI